MSPWIHQCLQFTLLVLKLSLIRSHLLWVEFSTFSAANAIHNFPIFHSTRYPSLLGGQRQYGMRSLLDTSTHDQQWKLNPKPSDLESNALSTWPHAFIFELPEYKCIYLFANTETMSNKWALKICPALAKIECGEHPFQRWQVFQEDTIYMVGKFCYKWAPNVLKKINAISFLLHIVEPSWIFLMRPSLSKDIQCIKDMYLFSWLADHQIRHQVQQQSVWWLKIVILTFLHGSVQHI